MAEEEREKSRNRDTRGPPPTANSRFAAAAEADRSMLRDRDDRGPPSPANSRFAAAAEADRASRDERGPPPAVNSRFSSAADADRSNRDDRNRNDRGPPPVANSRFAAAAMMAEQEDGMRERDRRDKDVGGRFNRNDGDSRGPPPVANSRFAAAVAADRDYQERGDRDRFDDRGGGRYGGRDEQDRRGGHGYDRRGRADNDRFVSRDDRNNFGSEEEVSKDIPPPKSSVADLLKPKAPPVEDNILKVPTKEQSDNILKLPSKELETNTAQKASKIGLKENKVEKNPEPIPAVDVSKVVDDTEVLAEFASGKRLGGDLKLWCEGQIIPKVERLVFHLLTETEKLNPDPNCAWAEPSKYGEALLFLVEDDLLKQVQLLVGIQKYCDKLGFPKLNNEYVIQSMFRAMYKYDLADSEAFGMWKEDESPEYEQGKLNAVIQTVDWFNWLEEDEDDDGEGYEED